MLSQQELSDRFEIQDLVFQYAHLIDSKQFDALRCSVGNLDETITFLKAAVTSELFPNTQHLNANVQVELDGDRAKGRVMCFNPMEMALPDGSTQTYFLGLWYVDEYCRTADGWRISRREEAKSWVFNAPDFMNL